MNYRPEAHSFCSEMYKLEETIQVVCNYGNSISTIRIEALKNIGGGSLCKYVSRGYINNNETKTWEEINLPAILTAKTAEDCLQQSLSFLKERCK